METIISPSILAADLLNLGKDIEMLNKSCAQWIHIDIMDGVFVPNLTIGIPTIAQIKKIATKTLDVHLMMIQPERYIDTFHKAGADILIVHYEACTHLHRTIQEIKEKGMKAGVALNPHTPITCLEDIINELDLVLLMSVNPGFGGQRYIDNTINKVERLRKLIIATNSSCLIEIDGGVNLETGQALITAGADALVAGSFVFSSHNPIQTIANLQKLK